MNPKLLEIKTELSQGKSKIEKYMYALINKAERLNLSSTDTLAVLNKLISMTETNGLDESFEKICSVLDEMDKKNESKASTANASQLSDAIENQLTKSLNENKVSISGKYKLSGILSSLLTKINKCSAVIKGESGEEEIIDASNELVQKEVVNLKKLKELIDKTKLNLHESLGAAKDNGLDLEFKI